VVVFVAPVPLVFVIGVMFVRDTAIAAMNGCVPELHR
jgi:hypothetical protein